MSSVIRHYTAYIIVVVTIAAVMLGSYASVAFAPSATPKATWAVDPLVLSFTATDPVMSGSAEDSVTCDPAAGFVQLLPRSSNPAKLMLTTTQSDLICGPTPSPVVVVATCLVPAASCKGSYSGQLQLRQAENYRNLSSVLKVLINVA